MRILTFILAAVLDIIPGGNAVLEQLQKRDSTQAPPKVKNY